MSTQEKLKEIAEENEYEYEQNFKIGGYLLMIASIAGLTIDLIYGGLSDSGNYVYGCLMGAGIALRWAYNNISWTLKAFKSLSSNY